MRTILILAFIFYDIFCQSQNVLSSNNTRTWTAKPNRFTIMRKFHVKKLMGVHRNYKKVQLPKRPLTLLPRNTLLPALFDARQKWPNCTTIGAVRDQGTCGSCWVYAPAAAMTDRICIVSNARTILNISVQHPLACCTTCGEGCDGGYPTEAWNFWVDNGIVTGGDFNSRQGCQPYTEIPYNLGKTPNCSTECRSGFTRSFSRDIRRGSTAYSVSISIRAIQAEIFTNGPVCAVMKVYEDFMSYEKGVYQKIWGEFLGYHAIKVIGWGAENGTKYWLVVNTWGRGWGIKGLCKIIQNTTLEMENDVSAGIPLL